MKPDTTLYLGNRTKEGVIVTADGYVLGADASQKQRNHSPTGFEWGYNGSGPAQLALAILLDFTGDRDLANFRYMEFKFTVVSQWRGAQWRLSGAEISAWLARQQRPYEPEPEPELSDADLATPIEAEP